MADGDKQATIPIYVSYSTFQTFLDWLGEMRVIPTQLDSSLWRGKFSGAVGSQVMGGARFLKLLDGDRPTPQLEALARADPERRKELLLDAMRGAYGADFIDGLPRMTPKVLSDKLDALGTTDSTHAKARSFFVKLGTRPPERDGRMAEGVPRPQVRVRTSPVRTTRIKSESPLPTVNRGRTISTSGMSASSICRAAQL
jgi:hypothetical protein